MRNIYERMTMDYVIKRYNAAKRYCFGFMHVW